MKITNIKFSSFRSEYGNRFFFLLPFLNVCFYGYFHTISIGWLFFNLTFYISKNHERT